MRSCVIMAIVLFLSFFLSFFRRFVSSNQAVFVVIEIRKRYEAWKARWMLDCFFFQLVFRKQNFESIRNRITIAMTIWKKQRRTFFFFSSRALFLSKDIALSTTPSSCCLERRREKVVCWFLIRDWIKDVCSHNSITLSLSFCLNSRGRRRRRRKKKKRLHSFFFASMHGTPCSNTKQKKPEIVVLQV